MPCTKHHAMHMACLNGNRLRAKRDFLNDFQSGYLRVKRCVRMDAGLCVYLPSVQRVHAKHVVILFRYDDIQVFRCIFGSTTLEEIMHRKTKSSNTGMHSYQNQ